MCLGIPGQIVRIDDVERKLGTAAISGVQRSVNLACIVDAEHTVESCLGDWVLIHVGFAMSRIDEAEARATMQILIELGEAQSELAAMRSERPAGFPAEGRRPRAVGGEP
ncbi:MAG TPA: HypC/HybG/HupF family hydrogenase formation chaperone [Polyangiales bacterium]|nr:HypC/HybG/HupF family hydrogenase formation chaperone [Polyangiales bacterium]